MKKKIDVKDYRILNVLDLNPDITLTQLAKKTGISQQVADYRLKNLLRTKVITCIVPCIDMGRFGYTLFRIHLRFKNVSSDKRKKFESYLFENYKCFFMGAVGGRWDYYVDIFALTSQEFQSKLLEIVALFKEGIQEYETFTIIRIHSFNYKYLPGNRAFEEIILQESETAHKISDIDILLLHSMKTNSRLPLLDIARKTNISRQTVREHIRQLLKQKIIVKNRIFLNPQMLGMESYKLLIKIKGDPANQKKIIDYARFNPNVIYCLELMGTYDLDLEIEIENREKLQELIIDIRNKFSIEDYEVMPLFYDLGSDFFPMDKK